MDEAPEFHFDVVAQPSDDVRAAAKWAWKCLEDVAELHCRYSCAMCERPGNFNRTADLILKVTNRKDDAGNDRVVESWKRAQKNLHEALEYLPSMPDDTGACPACSVLKALKQFPAIAKHSPVKPVVTLKLNTEDCETGWCYCGGSQERSFPCCHAEVKVGELPLPDDEFGVGIDALRNLCFDEFPPVPPPVLSGWKAATNPGQNVVRHVYALINGKAAEQERPKPKADGRYDEFVSIVKRLSPEEMRYCIRMQLYLYAQAYYQTIQSVLGNGVLYDDPLLNSHYLRIIKAINGLLSTEPFCDFPDGFDPVFEHLYTGSGIEALEWDDIGHSVTDFLNRAQKFAQDAEPTGGAISGAVEEYLDKHRENVVAILEDVTAHQKKAKAAFDKRLKNVEKMSAERKAAMESSKEKEEVDSHESSDMTDEDLWHILQVTPPANTSDWANSRSTPASRTWINWAKGEVLSGVEAKAHGNHLSLYFARFLRVMDAVVAWRDYEVRERWNNYGYRRSLVKACLLNGFAACDIPPDSDEIAFIAAKDAGYILMEDADDWRPGMASGSGRRMYVKLTFAGKKRAEKASKMPAMDQDSAPEEEMPPPQASLAPEDDPGEKSSSTPPQTARPGFTNAYSRFDLCPSDTPDCKLLKVFWAFWSSILPFEEIISTPDECDLALWWLAAVDAEKLDDLLSLLPQTPGLENPFTQAKDANGEAAMFAEVSPDRVFALYERLPRIVFKLVDKRLMPDDVRNGSWTMDRDDYHTLEEAVDRQEWYTLDCVKKAQEMCLMIEASIRKAEIIDDCLEAFSGDSSEMPLERGPFIFLFQCLDKLLYWRPQKIIRLSGEDGKVLTAPENATTEPKGPSINEIDIALYFIPGISARIGQEMDELVKAMNRLAIEPFNMEALVVVRVWHGKLSHYASTIEDDELQGMIHEVATESALDRYPAWLIPSEDVERSAGGEAPSQTISLEQIEDRIKNVAGAECSVLLTGETGTGKEYVAEQIHKASSRAKKPFIPLNCAGLTKDRFEAELFGYRKGSFTGADRDRHGLAAEAEGGILFLDEIGDLPAECHANLLRFLQDKEIRPLGGTPETIDVRILAATNKPVQLPQDAIHRFDTTLPLPPLRARKAEIPELAKAFLDLAKKQTDKSSLRLKSAELDTLAADPFDWPGNIRQLQKAIFNAALHHGKGRDLTADEVIEAAKEVQNLA